MATEELEHFVQFYEADLPLLDALTGFIGGGLAAGGAGIVVAAPEHREGLEQRLRAAAFAIRPPRSARSTPGSPPPGAARRTWRPASGWASSRSRSRISAASTRPASA